MKNYLSMFVLMTLVAVAAFGQAGVADAAKVSVACPDDECHVAPYFAGSGGFIGEIADGFDEVNLVVTCGNVSTSAKAAPDAKGIVAMLFSMDNGLACDGNGFVEVHGLMDGGWYWITDDMNSAVSALMPKDAMDNAQATPADPMSDDIKLSSVEGGSASFVKQMSTGRVGIIPHVLPEPEMEPAPVNTCSYTATAPETKNCMLGDGGTVLDVNGPLNPHTGKRDEVPANGTVTRPAVGAADVEVALWGNGSGHFSNDASTPKLGHLLDGTAALAAAIAATVGQAVPETIGSGAAAAGTTAGLAFAQDATSNVGTLSIVPDPAYCSGTANHTAIVTFTATVDTTQIAQVTPDIANTSGTAANYTIRVVCPAASSQQGIELVPDNPFPATE